MSAHESGRCGLVIDADPLDGWSATGCFGGIEKGDGNATALPSTSKQNGLRLNDNGVGREQGPVLGGGQLEQLDGASVHPIFRYQKGKERARIEIDLAHAQLSDSSEAAAAT